MTRIRNRSEFASTQQKSPLSYITPFAIALIVIIVIARMVFGGGSTEATRSGASITVTPKQDQSEIYIYMSGDAKKRLDSATKMYSTDEKLAVTSGEAEITLENNSSKIYADKGTEMKFDGAGKDGKNAFTLKNAYAWAEIGSEGNLSFSLQSLRATPSAGSVVILSQNAIASNIYVLKGSAAIETIASVPRSTTIGVGQQLTVLKNEVESTSFVLSEKIEPVGDFIRTVELFTRHGGDTLLASSSSDTTLVGSGTTTGSGTSTKTASGKSPIVIIYPEDESSVESATVNIEGNVINPLVDKITINDKEAAYNREAKTFILKDFALDDKTNNIVYKSFDKEGWLLSKGLLTVYSAQKSTKDDTKKPTVTTYPISDKQFQIISPTENPYKTTDNVVRIEGRVAKGTVKYITINDFRLSKFPQLGTSWYYFANKDYGTMNDGINLYTIKYYGVNDELLFTNLFTIVKEAPKAEEPATTDTPATASGSTSEKTNL